MNTSERLPRGMTDMGEVMGHIALEFVVSGADVPELAPETRELLEEQLRHPATLLRQDTEQSVIATFLWRIGIAQSLIEPVLAHVSATDAIDSTIVDHLANRDMIARDMLRRDPELLRHISATHAAAFWRLMDYEPHGDAPNIWSAMEFIRTLSKAAYIPPDVIDNIRQYRDSTSTMQHEAVESTIIFDGKETTTEVDDPNEREQEMREAALRVIYGAFVADRTGQQIDAWTFQQALLDCATRASGDVTGFEYCLGTAAMLTEILRSNDAGLHADAAGFIQRLEEFTTGFDLQSVAITSLAGMVEAAYIICQSSWEVPVLQAFVRRGQTILADFQKLRDLIEDPSLNSGDGPAALLARFEAARIDANVHGLLQKLRGEASIPSPEAIIASLQTNGYSDTDVEQALVLISRELDPRKHAALTEQFDHVIGEALAQLDQEHEFLRPDGLRTLCDNRHIIYLTYFQSGRAFIAQKTHDFLQLAADYVAHPDTWLNQQESPADAAASCLKLIHDSSWHNRYYYTANYDAFGEVLPVVRDLLTFIKDNPHGETAARTTKISIEGLRALTIWAVTPQVDPQVVTAQGPIHTLLAKL